jgi:hypothetical protein
VWPMLTHAQKVHYSSPLVKRAERGADGSQAAR